MATCEKCWADSHRIAATSGEAQADVYRRLLAERPESCTLEEQCGDLHLALEWKDGGRRCRCGEVVGRAPGGGTP